MEGEAEPGVIAYLGTEDEWRAKTRWRAKARGRAKAVRRTKAMRRAILGLEAAAALADVVVGGQLGVERDKAGVASRTG